MNRPDKRNAMCDELLNAIDAFFSSPPPEVKVAIITGTAGHYCSGLDLSELVQRDAEGTMRHSRRVASGYGAYSVWRLTRYLSHVWRGNRRWLEIAASTHVRVAEPSTIFQLPEGRRGIFVGGVLQ